MPEKPVKEKLANQVVEYRLPAVWTEPSDPKPPPPKVALKFEPVRLVHITLSVEPRKSTSPIFTAGMTEFDFVATETKIESVQTVAKVVGYISGLRRRSPWEPEEKLFPPAGFPTSPIRDTTPFDIEVTDQCFLLIELDENINWRFIPGSLGVSTKKFYSDMSFGLTFVDNTGAFYYPNDELVVPEADTRMAFFGISERRPPSNHGFNFHIEFFWPEHEAGGVKRPAMRLPTIFDPDVPNSGGASFP